MNMHDRWAPAMPHIRWHMYFGLPWRRELVSPEDWTAREEQEARQADWAQLSALNELFWGEAQT